MIRKGRLGGKMDSDTASYTSSLEFDKNLACHDIMGDLAHAVMLYEAGIINRKDARDILKGLQGILRDHEKLEFTPELEDIHMALEGELIRRVGDAGGKLHTARSRNDQVACDLRLWLREEVNAVSEQLISLVKTLLNLSKAHTGTIMPGYTHLQHAQPTTLAHHLVSYCDAFLRDLRRLDDAYKRINLNPLGSGALATTSFQINRERTSPLLGFGGIIENSMDAVSTRDFMLETVSCLSILSINLSRLAEELILWSTHEFGFVEIADEFASTSSIMPQKKNPDVLEIMRARAGRNLGNLFSVLAMAKSLPNSYNRDLQEISPIAAESLGTTKASLKILEKILNSLKVNEKRMAQVCDETFITATELADFLVREKGLPFRTAHGVVGKVVSEAIKAGMSSKDIDSKFIERMYGKRLGLFDEKLKKVLSSREAVKRKETIGGPAPREVNRMIKSRDSCLRDEEKTLKTRAVKVKESKKLLLKKVEELVR